MAGEEDEEGDEGVTGEVDCAGLLERGDEVRDVEEAPEEVLADRPFFKLDGVDGEMAEVEEVEEDPCLFEGEEDEGFSVVVGLEGEDEDILEREEDDEVGDILEREEDEVERRGTEDDGTEDEGTEDEGSVE